MKYLFPILLSLTSITSMASYDFKIYLEEKGNLPKDSIIFKNGNGSEGGEPEEPTTPTYASISGYIGDHFTSNPSYLSNQVGPIQISSNTIQYTYTSSKNIIIDNANAVDLSGAGGYEAELVSSGCTKNGSLYNCQITMRGYDGDESGLWDSHIGGGGFEFTIDFSGRYQTN